MMHIDIPMNSRYTSLDMQTKLLRLIALVAALTPRIATAGATKPVDQGFSIENPLQADDIVGILKQIAGAIQDLVIPVAAAMYIYAGFLWLTSAGKPARLTQAMTVFKYTTIGLVIIFIGGGFVDLIRSILNLGS
jgi:hypothetical protein